MASPPDFLCICVQKGGTTKLHNILSTHPYIFMPAKKEIQYFTLNYHEGFDWYLKHFNSSLSNFPQIKGEVTPYYSFHPFALERIKSNLPDVKLIYLLRDPVSRSLSHYHHSCRLGFEHLDLLDALYAEESRLSGSTQILSNPSAKHRLHQECSYISRSKYHNQVSKMLSLFDRKQILFIKSEDFYSQLNRSMELIADFLNVDPALFILDDSKVHAGSYSHTSDYELQKSKNYLYKHLSFTYNYIYSELGISW